MAAMSNRVSSDSALGMLGASRCPIKAGVSPTCSASSSWVSPRSLRYGITQLLQQSVTDYNKSKVKILESKLSKLSDDRKQRIAAMRTAGMNCIDSYSDKAMKIGFVPGGCIPIVHGICITMITALNKIVGINSTKGFASDIFANAVVGLIATPFMVVPLVSAGVAYAYVAAVGETYLDSLMMVIERSTDEELKNNDLMAERIKAEIKKRKK